VDFGDTVYATAAVVVISMLLFVPMDLVFGLELWLVGRGVSVFIAALVVGLVFAGKLADKRIVSIAKIIVLGAVVVMFLTFGILNAATFHDVSSEANPVDTWTTLQWASLMTYAFRQVFFHVVLLDSVAFVGLYVGSMLGKPK
jgi:MFS family permease